MTRSFTVFAGLLLLLAGCGDDAAPDDAGARLDGSTRDAGPRDAAPSDGAAAEDGSTPDVDAGPPPLVCDPGLLDCNASTADGCEVTAATDAAHCGRCGHACIGACVGGHCAGVDVATGIGTNLTASAVHDGAVYLAFISVAGGSLVSIPTSGGATTTLAFQANIIGGIAFDAGRIYFVAGRNIHRVEPGTTVPSTVVSAPQLTSSLHGLVRSGTTWYANDINATCTTGPCCTTGHPCDPGRIWAFPDGATPSVVAAAENGPRVLQADATHLYWVDASENDYAGTGTIPYDQGAVRRMPLAGGAVETLIGSIYRPQSLALEGTDTAVFGGFHPTMSVMVRRVPRSGGAATIVSGAEGSQTTQIAAMPAGLVWNSIDTVPVMAEHLRFAPSGGGPVETLVDGPLVRGLMVDGDDVYVLIYTSRTMIRDWRLVRFSP